ASGACRAPISSARKTVRSRSPCSASLWRTHPAAASCHWRPVIRPSSPRRSVWRNRCRDWRRHNHAGILLGYRLVEVRLDRFGQVVEFVPFLAELWRAMRRLQRLAVPPLDKIDDAVAIDAAVKMDGDEAGLGRHEGGALLHQRKSLVLLVRRDLDDGDRG